MIVTASIYLDDDTEIRVEGEYEPACDGGRDEFGVPTEPDVGETLSVLVVGKNIWDEEIELDAEQLQQAREALWEAVNDR